MNNEAIIYSSNNAEEFQRARSPELSHLCMIKFYIDLHIKNRTLVPIILQRTFKFQSQSIIIFSS